MPTPAEHPRILFTADWHLPEEHSPQTDFFLRFLDDVCRGADQLFILGDLFAAWVGPGHAACPGYLAALRGLESLAKSGVRVTIVRGNRDFLLDRRTTRRFGLHLTRHGWRGELAGRRTWLTHGDALTEHDTLHKAMRAVTGNFPVSTIVKTMPVQASGLLARLFRVISQWRRSRRVRTTKPRPAMAAVEDEFAAGARLVVIAHWHDAMMRTDEATGSTFVMLGECTDRSASYAELTHGGIELKTFCQ